MWYVYIIYENDLYHKYDTHVYMWMYYCICEKEHLSLHVCKTYLYAYLCCRRMLHANNAFIVL